MVVVVVVIDRPRCVCILDNTVARRVSVWRHVSLYSTVVDAAAVVVVAAGQDWLILITSPPHHLLLLLLLLLPTLVCKPSLLLSCEQKTCTNMAAR